MSFALTNPRTLKTQLKKIQTQVLDNKKSFILFVHADWCGYCRAMKPEWVSFLKQAKKGPKKLPDIAFIEVKDDVASEMMNDNIESEKDTHILKTIIKNTVKGYPTILLAIQNASKNSIKIVMFEGERSEEGLYDFVVRHRAVIEKNGR